MGQADCAVRNKTVLLHQYYILFGQCICQLQSVSVYLASASDLHQSSSAPGPRPLRRRRAPPRRILLTCAAPPPNFFAASRIPAEYVIFLSQPNVFFGAPCTRT